MLLFSSGRITLIVNQFVQPVELPPLSEIIKSRINFIVIYIDWDYYIIVPDIDYNLIITLHCYFIYLRVQESCIFLNEYFI